MIFEEYKRNRPLIELEIEAPAPAQSPVPSGPAAPAERMISLDAIRGVAVLGIFVMNIQSFSMIDAAYSNPNAYGELSGINYAVWLAGHLFADTKFITIFSVLFGAGIILMTTRREAAGRSPLLIHYSRMFWLLVIGACHGIFLWYGDVLFLYAAIGLFIYPFRKMPPAPAFTLGMALIAVGAGILAFSGVTLPDWPAHRLWSIHYDWDPSPYQIRQQNDLFLGSWRQLVEYRAIINAHFYLHLYKEHFFWRIAGLMLVGLALYKWDVLSGRRSRTFYTALVIAGLLVGLPIVAAGVWYNTKSGWDVMTSYFLGELFNYAGSLLVAAGWIGAVMLACKSTLLQPLMAPFAAVGRMALTNYLLQTVIGTTLFYGYGFGLFSSVDRSGQFAIVLAVWAFQLALSPAWLTVFRFGPVEWLWRSLTYLTWQPLIRRNSEKSMEPTQRIVDE